MNSEYLKYVTEEMQGCEQTKGQSVYQHGVYVSSHFQCFLNNDLDKWKLPSLVVSKREYILNNLLDHDSILWYNLYHDCGKPFCKVIDGAGISHFPNHEVKSYEVAKKIGFSDTVCNLILHDMFFHTCRAEDLALNLKHWDIRFVNTLFITALAEIHSNAKMFGGIDSISFKIKWKQLDRRSKYLCN